MTPFLIKFFYGIGLLAIIATTLVLGLRSDQSYSYERVVVLVAGGLALVVWRVACEFWLVIFSINDRLGILAHAATNAKENGRSVSEAPVQSKPGFSV